MAKPTARRRHSPVWEVIYSLRPRHKQLLAEIEQMNPAYWAKLVAKDLALVPLKLLHLLIAGYEPKDQRPYVRYYRPKAGR